MIGQNETVEYKCDEYEKMFVLNWRFKKHQQWHSIESVKKCHYLNNDKECPYEKLGYMFDHALAGNCQFGKNCSNKLCSFQHEQTANMSDDINIQSYIQTGSMNNDSDSEQEEGNTCDRIFKKNDDVNVHHTNDNCGFECRECGDLFRKEANLKLHHQKNFQ